MYSKYSTRLVELAPDHHVIRDLIAAVLPEDEGTTKVLLMSSSGTIEIDIDIPTPQVIAAIEAFDTKVKEELTEALKSVYSKYLPIGGDYGGSGGLGGLGGFGGLGSA